MDHGIFSLSIFDKESRRVRQSILSKNDKVIERRDPVDVTRKRYAGRHSDLIP
jgi:hypothetical protein